jgi:hypothetical protein
MPLSRINSKSIADLGVAQADIADASVNDVKLSETGVNTMTGAEWGAGVDTKIFGGGSSSSLVIPVITVTSKGRLATAANLPLSLTTFGGITSTSFSSSGVLIGQSITSNTSITGSSLTVTGTTKLQQAKEKVSLTTTTTTLNFDALTSSIVYYQSAGGSNFTVNFRGDGSTSLNTVMSDGESMTFVILVTNTSPATYPTAFTIDGQSPGIVKWVSPGVPTGGNINAIDAYTITIIKRSSATFTLLGSQTKFG